MMAYPMQRMEAFKQQGDRPMQYFGLCLRVGPKHVATTRVMPKMHFVFHHTVPWLIRKRQKLQTCCTVHV